MTLQSIVTAGNFRLSIPLMMLSSAPFTLLNKCPPYKSALHKAQNLLFHLQLRVEAPPEARMKTKCTKFPAPFYTPVKAFITLKLSVISSTRI